MRYIYKKADFVAEFERLRSDWISKALVLHDENDALRAHLEAVVLKGSKPHPVAGHRFPTIAVFAAAVPIVLAVITIILNLGIDPQAQGRLFMWIYLVLIVGAIANWMGLRPLLSVPSCRKCSWCLLLLLLGLAIPFAALFFYADRPLGDYRQEAYITAGAAVLLPEVALWVRSAWFQVFRRLHVKLV